jgi:hypothetical protein
MTLDAITTNSGSECSQPWLYVGTMARSLLGINSAWVGIHVSLFALRLFNDTVQTVKLVRWHYLQWTGNDGWGIYSDYSNNFPGDKEKIRDISGYPLPKRIEARAYWLWVNFSPVLSESRIEFQIFVTQKVEGNLVSYVNKMFRLYTYVCHSLFQLYYIVLLNRPWREVIDFVDIRFSGCDDNVDDLGQCWQTYCTRTQCG